MLLSKGAHTNRPLHHTHRPFFRQPEAVMPEAEAATCSQRQRCQRQQCQKQQCQRQSEAAGGSDSGRQAGGSGR